MISTHACCANVNANNAASGIHEVSCPSCGVWNRRDVVSSSSCRLVMSAVVMSLKHLIGSSLLDPDSSYLEAAGS